MKLARNEAQIDITDFDGAESDALVKLLTDYPGATPEIQVSQDVPVGGGPPTAVTAVSIVMVDTPVTP